MSEYPFAVGLPTARRLEKDTDGLADDVVFSVSQFPRATPQRIEAARKNVREVLDENLDRSVEPWRDVEMGEELELVRGWFNIVAPEESGAVAFCVSDGNILGLRRAGYEHPVKSQFVGNLGSGVVA
jgi:hypothetical protein